MVRFLIGFALGVAVGIFVMSIVIVCIEEKRDGLRGKDRRQGD